MRIAIDAHMVGERETGNETYTLNLLRGLASLPGDDRYQVLTPHPDRLARVVELPARFEVVRIPGNPLVRIPVAMPLALRRRRSELLHVSYVAPPRSPCPTVVTVHDVSYLVHPASVSARTRAILSLLVPISVRRAARVIAVSEHTRDDLVKHYRLAPDRIAVIYEAAAPGFHLLGDRMSARLPEGIDEPFILAVGNLEPRKNLIRLIEAFATLITDPAFNAQLVIVGQQKARAGEIVRSARMTGAQPRIFFTGFLPEPQLNLLYNRAALFVYPSLYEGFGLPPIEAMRCGCPVVASNVSAMPEVLGDAAILIDPTSVQALADAIRAVVSRPELAAELREKGLQRAARFSWSSTAEQTRSVYHAALHPAAAVTR